METESEFPLSVCWEKAPPLWTEMGQVWKVPFYTQKSLTVLRTPPNRAGRRREHLPMSNHRKFHTIESHPSIKAYGHSEMSSSGSGGVFSENNQKSQRSEASSALSGRKNLLWPPERNYHSHQDQQYDFPVLSPLDEPLFLFNLVITINTAKTDS